MAISNSYVKLPEGTPSGQVIHMANGWLMGPLDLDVPLIASHLRSLGHLPLVRCGNHAAGTNGIAEEFPVLFLSLRGWYMS